MGNQITESNPASILGEVTKLRDRFRQEYDEGAHPSHPALRLGTALVRRSNDNMAAPAADIDALLSELTPHAQSQFINFYAAYIGNSNKEANEQLLEGVLHACTVNKEGSLRPAQKWADIINRMLNIVGTGHPTFYLSDKKSLARAKHIAHETGAENYGPQTEKELRESDNVPYFPPTLQQEWEQFLERLRNLHTARKWARDCMIRVAQKAYPEDWTDLDYAPVSLATWIFYDWDGRKDITWNMTMENRIQLQDLMLADYIPQLEELSSLLEGEERAEVQAVIAKFSKTREIMKGHAGFYRNYNQKEDSGLENLKTWSARLIEDKAERVTHPGEAIAVMNRIISTTADPVVLGHAVRLRSDLVSQGISYAQPHFRISSTSVHQGLLEEYGVSIIDRDSIDKILHTKIEDMIAAAEPTTSNLLDVAKSDVTVFTQMALIRQFVDEIDSYCPTRYLIAETHNASTIKAALFYAKLLGVSNHINISPLIEDEQGSVNARAIMKLLYASKAYIEHVAGDRSHNPAQRMVTIELGYSDFAVDVNQIAAGAYHERNIGRMVKYHAASPEMRDIPLLIYHTGGHFMGRGFHPGSIPQSQEYLSSRFFLGAAQKAGVKVIIERSFQGGSGQVILGTPETCFAELAQSLAYFYDDHTHGHDMYYHGVGRDKSLATFEVIKASHLELSGNPSYRKMTAIFQNLIAPSGSRPASAQFDGNSQRTKLRAIRHNGSNAQTGFLTNILKGVGAAIESDPESFADLAANSEFFRKTRLALVMRALDLSDPGIRGSYIKLYDPDFWIKRSLHMHTPAEKDVCLAAADHLKRMGLYGEFKPIIHDLTIDYQRTKDFFREKGLDTHPDFQGPTLRTSLTQTVNTEIAHGVRIASMIELFSLAASIPEIAGRHDIPRDTLIERIMCLDPQALKILEKIFHQRNDNRVIDFPEKPSGFRRPAGYRNFKDNFIDPMHHCLTVNHQVGTIIADYVGGVG